MVSTKHITELLSKRYVEVQLENFEQSQPNDGFVFSVKQTC